MTLLDEVTKRRERLDARLAADEQAVQAARDAITAPPKDAQAKLLGEQMYARIWPPLQQLIASSDDAGIEVSVEALNNADATVRPLLAVSIIDALRGAGLRDETIETHVLVPTSQNLRDALDVRDRNVLDAVVVRHNLDQLSGGTTNFVGDETADVTQGE
jgi:hypothetical protein